MKSGLERNPEQGCYEGRWNWKPKLFQQKSKTKINFQNRRYKQD